MVTPRKKRTGERSPSPTLQTIADLAGCSLMSVSRALNGGNVSPATAARIKQAAEKLGYVANVSAQRMRGGRTHTIGVLMNIHFDPRTEVMVALDCLISEMENAGDQVLLSFARGTQKQIDAQLRGFIGRGVDGLFYWNAQPSKMLDHCARAGIPVVAIGYRSAECTSLPMVSFDAEQTLGEMYRRMIELGHRNAVELTSSLSPAIHEEYARPGELRWRRHDLGFDRASIFEFVSSLRTDPDPPTLVMGDYPRAVQLLDVCEELGVDVPGDLSIISIVDAVGSPLLRVPLSSMRTDYEALGLAAAQSMLAAIDGKPIEDIFVTGSLHWIERASTGPAPDKKPAATKRPRAKVAAGKPG